jgi:ParB family transcriptional regulator, chromosome partitioning protein
VETADKYLPFRGSLRATLSTPGELAFVTMHPEGAKAALYRLDLERGELRELSLPQGGVALALADEALFVAGGDGRIYRAKLTGGEIAPLGAPIDPPPVALAVLAGGRIAALSGARVVVIDRASGKEQGALSLPDTGTTLAADASGAFLVAGTAKGLVAVFEDEAGQGFQETEEKKLHDGAVTALVFDPDEPRFYSAGSDGRLFGTHARGALEPEDRAGGAAHEGPIQAMVLGPLDKLYTAGRDAALKAWSRGQKRRPTTLKDGVGTAAAMARVTLRGREHLAVLAEDHTIRLFALDAEGKVGDRVRVFHDAYALAERSFAEHDAPAREASLRTLAGYGDARAIDILDRRAAEDPDPALRALATELLGASGSPRAQKPLERLLGAGEEQVRRAALAGLRALEGDKAIRPLELALDARKRDIGVAAVEALTALASTDDEAMTRLVKALDGEPAEVRVAALAGIESLFPAPDTEGAIIALRSTRPDIRRLALVRGYARRLLDAPALQSALRRHQGDPDAEVRRAAFLVSVMTRPALAAALSARDRDLGRQIAELMGSVAKGEGSADGARPDAKAEPAALAKPAAPAGKGKKAKGAAATAPDKDEKTDKQAKEGKPTAPEALTDADMRPLLEAMASRALDTCLLGARGLAALGDERAFGALLQLTVDPSAPARVESTKALAALSDPRGAPRLRQMLRDTAGEVRDAAFSALARLEAERPLAVAEAGLLAPGDDVRKRGLEFIVQRLKKEPPAGLEGPAVALLERALHDTSAAVRGEAWKASLALELGGGGAGTLRFALRSVHAEIRREVLGEVMGRIQEPWAPQLLLELFGDPDPGVRGEAFEFAQKRGKGRAVEPLAAAITGRYPDLKRKAIAAIERRRASGLAEGVGGLLARALDDADEGVRVAAADALLVDEAEAAMESAHPDVRVRAAAARAATGDPKALAPLIALVTEREPELPAAREAYIDRTERALRGLGELGAPMALGPVAALVAHKDKRVSLAAATALASVSRPGGDLGPLRAALAHPDAEVKRRAAIGLAAVGDPSGLPLIDGAASQKGEAALEVLYAALALGAPADDMRLSFLDHADEGVRGRALLIVILIAARDRGSAAARCLGALSAENPRVRLTAARALEVLAEPEPAKSTGAPGAASPAAPAESPFATFATARLNDRGEDRAPFTIVPEAARVLGEVLAHGDPQLKVRAARVLEALTDDKQDRFEAAFAAFRRRFSGPIDALLTAASAAPSEETHASAEDLRRIVLGAYAGLSRLPGSGIEARVRQTAVSRLAEVARVDTAAAPAVRATLLLALGDPAAPVRKLAFEGLAALGMDEAELGAEALAAGTRDMGVAGLKLLAAAGKGASRREVLERVMIGNDDGLEEDAQRLLAEDLGFPKALAAGLSARSAALRERSAAELSRRWDEGEETRAELRSALASRYQNLRERAAQELAGKKDPAAFPALVAMLDGERQPEAIDAITRLGGPGAASALLDRIARDPSGTARVDALLVAVGEIRDETSAPRLLALLVDKKKRARAAAALLAVSGHEKPILDPQDEGIGPLGWEAAQHPRRDAILAELLEAAYRLGDTALLLDLIPRARFARGAEVGPALAPLAAHPKDEARDLAVEALGFRLRKRDGAAEPLIAALSHPSPNTQLVAALGLAHARRAEGLRVLLTAVDMLPSVDERRQAVRALGVLGDERARDLLLRLVNEDGHALQEEAAEAVGHLASFPRAAPIEAILLRLARGPAVGVAAGALTGLRFFGAREGWSLIRALAADGRAPIRLKVAELLAVDPDPAGAEVLTRRLEEETDRAIAKRAAVSLRKLRGEASLEPDYVLLRARFPGLEPRTVERLKERGSPAQILDALPRIAPQQEAIVLRPLVAALLGREPPPVAEAAARLASPHPRVAAVAAQILGRAGKSAAAAHGEALTRALVAAAHDWATVRADQGHRRAELPPLTERYRRMIAAAGKLGVAADEVIEASALVGEDALARPLRLEAIRALASDFAGSKGHKALAACVKGQGGRERALAAAALAALSPTEATALVPELIDDRTSLDRLLAGASAASSGALSAPALRALRAAASRVHTQGTALPRLVAAGDVAGLVATLGDRSLGEATRLGAIEALSQIATDEARAPILVTARDEGEDEELRKAAWRALRRSRRSEAKRAELARAASEKASRAAGQEIAR